MFDQLRPFVPESSLPLIERLLAGEDFHLVVSKPRRTKHGDFKPPQNGQAPRLSVNGNLNRYSFLVTLIHEIAHLKVWRQHKNWVKPHGKEWKSTYSQLLQAFCEANVFPEDLRKVILQHSNCPGYASGTDEALTKALRKYDRLNGTVYLDELDLGATFKLGKRTFRLGEKLRKRYLCEELSSGRQFRVHAMAEVIPLSSLKIG